MANLVLTPVLVCHTLCYLDDVIIYSKDYGSHLCHLDETFTLLFQAGVKLNMSKCEIACLKLNFLGFLICNAGVQPGPSKVKSIAIFLHPPILNR